MQWFRVYQSLLDKPKVQALPPDLFKWWVNLLAIASENDPRGVLPNVGKIAWRMRSAEADVLAAITRLEEWRDPTAEGGAGMIDVVDGHYTMHDWDEWQRESDDVAKRMVAYRKRRKEVREDGPLPNEQRDRYVTQNVTRSARPEQTRPEQTRPEQTRAEQTRAEQTRAEQTRAEEENGESARALVSPPSSSWHPKDFREAVASFCDEYPESPEYPKLGDRGAVASALAAACPSPDDFSRVMAGLAAWKRTDRWQQSYPRYAPQATKFLGQRMYLNAPQATEPATNGARAPALALVEARGERDKRNRETIRRALGGSER